MKLIPAALPQTQAAPAGPSLEDIQAKRQIAALLAKEGQSTAPVQHWTQAAARIAQAMMGSLNQSQAASEDSRLRGEANDAIMGMLPSLTGGASPAGMPPQPVKNDAQDAIDMTPDQKGVYQVAQGLASPGFQAAVQARGPQIDPNLVEGVKGFEGYAGKAYPDYKQYSVGYGTRATSPNEVIDKTEAERRLQTELGKAQGIVKAFAPNAPPGVQNALTSLTYNTGDKWTRSGLGALVKAGDYQGAQQRLLQYNKAGGVTNQGLVNRRQQEAQWMNGQPQKPQGVQVADASGGMDRAALAKMLANPYTKDFAEKLIMQQYKAQMPGETEYGLNPQYATDAQGNVVPYVMGKDGKPKIVELPGGAKAMAPRELGYERAYGKGSGEAQAKGEASFPKVMAGYAMANMKDKYLGQSIQKAIDSASPWTTGFTGNVLSYVKGSPSSDLAFTMQNIEANLAFDALQNMRDSSPTGGALGAISERELALLQSTWVSVQQAQSEGQFRENLKRLQDIKAEFAVLRKQAYEMDLAKFGPEAMRGVSPQGQTQQPSPQPSNGGWSMERLP